MTTRKFGWNPDLPDIRDFKLKLMVRSLPESVDLRSQCPPVYDQGSLGSCTANAIAAAYEFEHLRENFGLFAPSRLFIYYNERVMENSVNSDSGAMIRDGMKSIGNGDSGVGVCNETLWPYIIRKFDRKPCKKCYSAALDDQAIEYLSVLQTPMQLKGCLADGFPIVFGFSVYSNFMGISSNGIMNMPVGSVEGGHAILAVGYDDSKQCYIIRNSWSENWGDKGYFYMPYEYMHNPDLCDDFWTIRKVE